MHDRGIDRHGDDAEPHNQEHREPVHDEVCRSVTEERPRTAGRHQHRSHGIDDEGRRPAQRENLHRHDRRGPPRAEEERNDHGRSDREQHQQRKEHDRQQADHLAVQLLSSAALRVRASTGKPTWVITTATLLWYSTASV